MANTPARFKVIDIQRILKASKNAKVPVQVVIEDEKITITVVDEQVQTLEVSEDIVL